MRMSKTQRNQKAEPSRMFTRIIEHSHSLEKIFCSVTSVEETIV